MKKLQIAIALFCLIQKTFSQNELLIGDRIPDIQINNIMNFTTTSIKLSQLRGKIVILDFWTTWCGSCVASMPKLEKLQKKYKDKLQIFLVTPEDSLPILRLYKRLEYVKDIDLPIVLKDSVFKNMFPHEGVPHVVWINADQRVNAISSGEYLTEENLNAFINANHISLPEKRDISFNTDESFTKLIRSEEQILFSSILIKGIDGLTGQVGIKKLESGRIKIQATNVLLISLYSFAYKKQISLNPSNFASRILINSRKNDLFDYTKTGTEYTESSYCYELILPINDSIYHEESYLQQMQRDLDKHFKITTSVESRNIPCYILEPIDNNNIKNEKTGLIKEHQNFIELNNQPVKKIVSVLNTYNKLSHPILYEGAQDLKVSINVKKEKISIADLEKILKASGLKLSVQNREIDMLCVSDQ